jgi:DNA-binding beta-propeller fold protein YncE
MSGEPFHRCTHTALSPQGEIYVSDGYGNSRVHKYTPDGKLLLSWGEPGTGEGEFNIVHNICCDADGWVYVADRENHRVQVFNGPQRNTSRSPVDLVTELSDHVPFPEGRCKEKSCLSPAVPVRSAIMRCSWRAGPGRR